MNLLLDAPQLNQRGHREAFTFANSSQSGVLRMSMWALNLGQSQNSVAYFPAPSVVSSCGNPTGEAWGWHRKST
jgi:hypothetical protein